ncbi:MAG: lipopolysaccharide biosynthesis protein [Coriobacteriales bacterium]
MRGSGSTPSEDRKTRSRSARNEEHYSRPQSKRERERDEQRQERRRQKRIERISTREPSRSRARSEGKQNPVSRIAGQWWNRLLGAASEGSFSEQEAQYAAHKTSRDYVWNTIGATSWGLMFPLLTIVITQIAGVEQAGMFSLVFVTAALLMIVGNYGVRTYQISDLSEKHTFADYQINRIITCVLMLIVGGFYCNIRGYEGLMFTISIGVYIYKMIDGLADVYEGRLQQVDKLYLAGISQTFRAVVVFIVFSIVLLISRDVGIAAIAMAVAAIATFFFLTLPLTLFETPRSRQWSMDSIKELFKQCTPLFVALFLFTFIDTMPKLVMEGMLGYENQLYFNVIYFPAKLILVGVQLIYRPLLLRLANVWADPKMHKRFDQVILAMMGIIVAITVVVIIIVNTIGIPILSFLYGIDFNEFRGLFYVMMAAGGIIAGIDFLYQVITVLRRQKDVMKLYLIAFVFSLFVPFLLIGFTGLPGAVLSYLILECILFALLVTEYFSIRAKYKRAHDSNTPDFMAAELIDDEERVRMQEAGYVKIPQIDVHAAVKVDNDRPRDFPDIDVDLD